MKQGHRMEKESNGLTVINKWARLPLIPLHWCLCGCAGGGVAGRVTGIKATRQIGRQEASTTTKKSAVNNACR